MAVRTLGGAGGLVEGYLRDGHAGVEGDRQRRNVAELQHDTALEAGVDEPGGGVHQQSETAEGTLAVEPAHQVRRKPYPLAGNAEHERARMQDEGVELVYLHDLGQVGHLLLHVDEVVALAAEDAQLVAEGEIDAHRLHGLFAVGFHDQAAGANGALDVPVAQCHRVTPILTFPLRGGRDSWSLRPNLASGHHAGERGGESHRDASQQVGRRAGYLAVADELDAGDG